MEDIKSKYLTELTKDFEDMGLPKFRAKQVYEWLVKGVCDFDEMTNIGAELKSKLNSVYYIANAQIELSAAVALTI